MPKTKLDKAISGYYGDKKKKKKKDNKVSNSYEDLQRKQNEQKQEQGRKVAQQKKETPQKSSTPLSKAIEKDSKRTQETKTGTRKTSNSWGEYVRKANKAYTKAGREEANKSWSEKQAERRKNKDNITSLGTIAGSNSLQYSGQKHTPLGDAIYKNATGRDAAPTRYEKSIGLADTKTDIERINGTGETALSKMAIRNQGERQKKQAKKDVDATIKNWEEANGITFSEEEKKSIRKEMGLDDYLKEVDEATKESLKTANEGIKAANRRATNKMVQAMDEQSGKAEERKKKTFKYGDITDEEQDIIIQANQAFPGNREAQNNYIRSRGGDELLYKIGDVNAATLYKSPFMSGFMEGSSPISAYDSAAGEYSDQAREVMQEGRGNAAYLAGYMGGFGAQFAGSGVNAAAEQLAGRVLPRIGSQFGRFAVNRLGETVLESPLDIADAYKNSIDAEGNFDANEFKRQMAFNVGMNVGIGGAIDVGGNLLTKKQAKQFLNLESKRIAGTLSGNDEIKYLELRQKLNDKASERFNLSTDTAGNTLENARQMRTDVNNARVDEAVRRANTNLENARIDRAVAQSNETARQNRTAAENARVDRTVARAQENMPQRTPAESYDIDSIPDETLTDLLIRRDADGNYYDLFSGDPMSRDEVEDIIRENGGIPENVSVINKDVPLESNDINELKRIQEYNGTTGEIRDEDIAIIRDVNNKVKADIDTRTVDNVGKRQVKAYQYEHPELKEFYQNEAEIMEEELARGVRGERWGNEYGQFATTRAQSDTIEMLLDEYGMSYKDIAKGLDAIIKDEGAENIAAAKRIELAINDRLRYGYNDFISGATIAPNAEYIKALDDISKTSDIADDVVESPRSQARYVQELPDEEIAEIERRLRAQGITGEDLDLALNSKISDIDYLLEDTSDIADDVVESPVKTAGSLSDAELDRYGLSREDLNTVHEDTLSRFGLSRNDERIYFDRNAEDFITEAEATQVIKEFDDYEKAFQDRLYSNPENSAIAEYKALEEERQSIIDDIDPSPNNVDPDTLARIEEINARQRELFKDETSYETATREAIGKQYREDIEQSTRSPEKRTVAKATEKETDDVAEYEELTQRLDSLMDKLDEGDAGAEKELNDVYKRMSEIEKRHPEGMENASRETETPIRTKAEASSKKQVPETKEARAPEVSSTTKANEPQPKEKPSEPKKAEPKKAEKPKEQTPQEKQKAEVKQKQKEAQTKLKGMSAEQYREEIRKMTTAATSAHAEKIMMTAREYLDPDKADMLLDGFDERVGMFGKVKGVSQEEALQRADQLYKDKGLKALYDDYMNTDVGTTGVVGQDVQMVQAKGSKVFHELTKQINAGEGDVEDLINKLYNVCIKSNEIASASGRSLNAVKMMLRATPEGRTAAVQREMERLAKKYKDRLGSNGLVLSDETWAKLASDMSDDEITELMKKVNIEIWDQIPATAMEKFNELRHFSMLANPRTHIRNLTGNTVFKTARAISDSLEFAITHAMRKKLEKMGVTSVVTTKITREEMKSAKKGVHEHFDKIYADSASRSRFVEIVRPEGSRMFKSAKVQKGIDTNYAFLDWEDVKPFLRPEYTRQFIKYCKTYGLDFNNIENIPKKKLAAADKFAMNKAEIATFRDNSAFSEFLVGKKQTLAGMKGKTAVGTLAYRAGSMLLDSQIPFVKTPINIFRRSIDYSPISLIRAGAELNQALRKGKTDLVLDGIHHLATGLTGTGIMGLGMWLYNSGVVTVEAGNVSGSEYYDRDMGYQDYSLIVGDKSVTLDWVSPIQSSFFMGAAMQQDFEEKGISLDVGLSALIASTSPMLEMSFMGTTKDTIETFIDRANKEHDGEMHWTDAVKYTIGGTLPQGWLSSFMPQVSGQFANILDDKQRDTRSTREGEMANAWDKFAKQTINRVPILRNYVLNPKIDRFGEDKETGQNVLTRTVQFMFNPATVKNIEMTDTDKEIIDIYNNMDDNDKDKKSFFYNFTGNPAYDLYGEKGRMTYDELYKYGKTNRKAQTKYIEDMINSDSYKDMTYTLKADEVKGASFISTTKADLDTYGAKYALDKNILNPDAKKSAAKQAWTDFKNQGGNAKEFVEDHIKIEGFLNRSHSTTKDYYAMAAIIEKCPNTDMLAKSYGVYGNKLETERKYFKKGGSLKEFSDASCRMASGRDIVGVTDSKANNSRVAANYDINERTYRAHGFDWNTAQSGAGLKKYGYAFENDPNRKGDKNTLEKIKSDALAKYDADHNNSLTKDEATEYVKSLKCESEDEAACIFQFLMPGTKNTFKDLIDDHLKWGENHDEEWETGKGSGSGKGSGKGRGRGRGRGRKSGGKSSGTVPESWWTEYLDDIKKGQKSSTGTTVNTTAVKSHNYNWDDVITTAYKNKTRKMRSKTKAG